MEEADYERTLCQLPQVHVFKIPVRKSAEGHRASDWPKDPTWTGKLKIIAKGRMAAIMLLDGKNATFAVCPVSDDTAVERTLDSGRYFVLKIQNAQGRHAFIGIAFNERNDAFDFNVALQEHKDGLAREDAAALAIGVTDNGPILQDLSIKEGEKIKIKLSGGGSRQEKRTASSGGGMLSPPPQSGGRGLLAPPPADQRVPVYSSNTRCTSSSSSKAGADASFFDAFSATANFGGINAPAPAGPAFDLLPFKSQPSAGSAFDSSFGSIDPFSTGKKPFGSAEPFSAGKSDFW